VGGSRLDELLESAFRIRPGEGRQVGLMFLFLMGVVSTFIVGRTVRDTLFLHRVPLENLSLMYIAVAASVGTTAYFYSRVADRYRRDRSILTTLAVATMTFSLIWAGVRFDLAGSWLYFVLYVVVDIIGQITIIQFWTLANDMFSGRQARRLFGVIGAGGVLANVICGFTIGSIAPVIGSENLLLVIAGLFFSCIFAVRAIAVHSAGDLELAIQKPRKVGIGVRRETSAVLHSMHLKFIAAIVVLTFLTVTIIDYQFKVIARSALTGEGEMAAYFGYFYGFTGIIASSIQFLVTGRLLEKSGVVVSLLVLPLAMMVGAGSLLAVPMLAGIVAATIAKGAENIFRYTINDATMQLLYVPIPAHHRGRAKAFIDGILKPISIGASGLLLYLLGSMMAPEMFALQLAYFDLVLLGGWVALVIGIKKEYVRSLIDTLRSRKLDLDSGFSLVADQATLRVVRERLTSGVEADILCALEILPSIDGADFFAELSALLSHRSTEVRIAALELVGSSAKLERAQMVAEMMADPEPRVRAAAIRAYCAAARERAVEAASKYLVDPILEVRGAAAAALINHGGLDGTLAAADDLKAFLSSANAADRLQGARVLAEIKAKTFFQPLLELLEDEDVDVRIAAIEAAGEMQSPEVVAPLIAKLGDPAAMPAATRALIRFGPAIETSLLEVLRDDATDASIRRAVPKVLAKTGGQASMDALIQTIAASDPQLRAHAAKAAARIRERNPRVTVSNDRLFEALKREIRGAYEALVTIDDLGLVEHQLLSEALLVRHKHQLGVAFRLLEIRHPARTIQLVYANLDSENKTVRANALEVVDNVLDKEESDLLLPLLEDQSIAKKIEVGHELFAIPRRAREEWIDLLLEDPNPWVVVCTLHLVAEHHLDGLRTKVNRHLDSHDPVVRETACLAAARLSIAG
jgi:ATP/ADP translocase/HEAT repeat protein